MDVEAVESFRKAGDFGSDLGVLALGLGHLDDSSDSGVSVFVEHAHSVVSLLHI